MIVGFADADSLGGWLARLASRICPGAAVRALLLLLLLPLATASCIATVPGSRARSSADRTIGAEEMIVVPPWDFTVVVNTGIIGSASPPVWWWQAGVWSSHASTIGPPVNAASAASRFKACGTLPHARPVRAANVTRRQLCIDYASGAAHLGELALVDQCACTREFRFLKVL